MTVQMKCAVGLGNPGKKYALTKHNVGFMVVDRVAERLGIEFCEQGFNDIAVGCIDPRDYYVEKIAQEFEGQLIEVILAKPKTYMNRSGIAVAELLKEFPIECKDLLVVHDDLDLPFGKIRFRYNGSSGGHKGVQSIIDAICDYSFARLKIGIGRPDPGIDPAEYVLSPFDDQELLSFLVETAACGVLDSLVLGLDEAMNRYNRSLDLEEYGNR